MPTLPKQLAPQLAKRLLAYSAVIGTIAVAGSSAGAEVVYTAAHSKLNGDLYLDLNHDGILDFHIHSYVFSGFGYLDVRPTFQGNKIVKAPVGCNSQEGSAAALPEGARIGPGELPFSPNASCMAFNNSGGSYGSWVQVKGRYLGFAFVIDGKEHFGWARLKTGFLQFNNTADILGYAYETIPNKPIIAGDEGNASDNSGATLGELAAGSLTRGAGR